MSDHDYEDLYDMWRQKAIDAGFPLNHFRIHFNRFVGPDNMCSFTKAIGAKLAFKSLISQRNDEIQLVQKEMENIQWF